MLDAGLRLKKVQEKGYSLTKIDGCLVSHCHGDHSKYAFALAGQYGVNVYASRGTIEACGWAEGHRIKPVKALEEFQVSSFSVLPFAVEHDAPEPLGFVITDKVSGEKLLYLTDSYYVKYRFEGLNYMMIECNYDAGALFENIRKGEVPSMLAKRGIGSHMSLDNLLELLKANDLSALKQIYLLHLSDANSDEAKMKEAVQKLTGAEVYVC
jgi:phosphoribosyl 1,2-cyclic phosphodiesterase